MLTVQWMDLSLWRSKIGEAVATRPASAFGAERDNIAAEIASLGRIAVLPSAACRVGAWDEYDFAANRAETEIQLMAARANARLRAPFTARMVQDCEAERRLSIPVLAQDGVVVILDPRAAADLELDIGDGVRCSAFPLGTVCVPDPS